MKPITYVETSIVSYLTAWPSRDLVIAARQQITRDWWQVGRDRYDLFGSQLVVQEAGAGDPAAAAERLKVLVTIGMMEVSEAAVELSRRLVSGGALPEKAAQDALHVAIAVTNGARYLVTWNLRHIANVSMREQIERVCRDAGYQPVLICTPEQMLGE
jgi:hypothetical protein